MGKLVGGELSFTVVRVIKSGTGWNLCGFFYLPLMSVHLMFCLVQAGEIERIEEPDQMWAYPAIASITIIASMTGIIDRTRPLRETFK